jgi:hypothetical protein
MIKLYFAVHQNFKNRSLVYYHSNQPHWNETLRIVIDTSRLEKAYLVLLCRHCSSGEAKEKPPFSIAYLKLTNPDGTVIADRSHVVQTYKIGKSEPMEDPVPNFKGN